MGVAKTGATKTNELQIAKRIGLTVFDISCYINQIAEHLDYNETKSVSRKKCH